jgi:hypothetical protein
MRSIALIPITAILALAQNQALQNRAVSGGFGAPQPAAAPASFDCSADGSVVNSITGEPIVRARVIFTGAGTTYSTATDASGKWALSNVGCAPGQLQATRTGFLPNLGSGRANLPFRQLTLVSGSPVHDIKIELVPQSVVLGKVVDDQGDPVMDAQVTALSLRVVDGRPRFVPTSGMGATNDLGEYRLANLPHGKYIVCIHQNQPGIPIQSTTPSITADSCYPGPLEGGTASAMDLPAGRETKVDFTLNQVVPVHVRGTVTGLPEGRTVGVNLIKRGINADFGAGRVNGAVRAGTFDIRTPPGSYTLAADFFENGKRITARVPIEVGSSDIDNVVLHMESGFTISGLVRVNSQSGQVPSPLPQFGVNLRASEPANGAGQLKWEADHMSFMINDMVPGNYRLDVFPPAPFYVKSATLAGQDILNTEIPISQAAGPIEITLRDDGGSIEGDVVNASGQPVAGGVLLLRNTARAAIVMSSSHFKVQNLGPGEYTAYAWDEPNDVQYANPDWMRQYGSGGVPVTVTTGQNTQIKLTQQMVPPQ